MQSFFKNLGLFGACAVLVASLAVMAPAWSQSRALKTKIGLGVAGMTYEAPDGDGSIGTEFLYGPQMDFAVDLALSSAFTVGLDADITIFEGGTRVDNLRNVEVGDLFSLSDKAGAVAQSGSLFSGGPNIGVSLGDYHPSVGIAYSQADVKDAAGQPWRYFSCWSFVARPLDLDLGDIFNLMLEYKTSVPGCKDNFDDSVDFQTISLAGRFSF